MALVRRLDPFREIDTLQRQMNRLFEDFVPPAAIREQDGFNFVPAAEIEEKDDSLDLRLEVPGMKPDDLSIEVTAESVSISGERRSEQKTEEDGRTRSEFRYGRFERTIPLPSRVQNTEAKAEYKDGILYLTLPKAEEEKNKVVRVSVGQ
jgi:HSP20 family protein